jgi:hypothetical protein
MRGVPRGIWILIGLVLLLLAGLLAIAIAAQLGVDVKFDRQGSR